MSAREHPRHLKMTKNIHVEADSCDNSPEPRGGESNSNIQI